MGKSPIFLTIEDKKTNEVYEILSSDHIQEIYWLKKDSLKVTLKKNLFEKMKDFENNKIVVIPKVITEKTGL